MIPNDLRPLANRFGYRERDGSFTFLIPKKGEVTIRSFVRETLAILRLSNGLATVSELRAQFPRMKEGVFDAVIEAGLREGYLVDSGELYLDFHELSANPAEYGRDYDPARIRELLAADRSIPDRGPTVATADDAAFALGSSALYGLIEARRTTRAFKDAEVPLPQLMALLRAMYGTGGGPHPTPSAGALYPLRIYVATADPAQRPEPALFRYDPATGELFETGRTISPGKLARVLDALRAPKGYAIFIAGELHRTGAKYANRGYRLVHLEAGHAAQNAYLFAAEQGLGMYEYAGYQDELAAELLGLDYPQEAVVTVLLCGIGDENPDAEAFGPGNLDFLHRLKTELVGDGKPVEWVASLRFGEPPFDLDRAAAISSYRDPSGRDPKPGSMHRRCQGVSTSSVDAGTKAIAEAFERHASGRVRWDLVASADELESQGHRWADPRRYAPLGAKQYAGPFKHLAPFDHARPIQWVRGARMATGEPVYVPVELAFYPVPHKLVGRRTSYEACSSGVAAWSDPDTAAERALFELIERDAVLVAWYAKRPVAALPDDMLDLDTRLRIARWAELGWQGRCLDLTQDGVPVVLGIFSREDRRPHFVAGAAAARTHREAAAKALDEAELMLAARRTTRRRRRDPAKVRSVMDHGLLYFEPELLPELKWLTHAPVRMPEAREIPDLIRRFDPIRVDLWPEAGPLAAVRVLSDRLLPITFGYGTEHVDHPRMAMLGFKWRRPYPSLPHFFA